MALSTDAQYFKNTCALSYKTVFFSVFLEEYTHRFKMELCLKSPAFQINTSSIFSVMKEAADNTNQFMRISAEIVIKRNFGLMAALLIIEDSPQESYNIFKNWS